MCATTPHTDFDKLRHRWEMPLIWVSVVITVVAVAGGLWLVSLDDATRTAWFGDSAEDVMEYAGYALLLPLLSVAFYLFRFYMAAKAKANAILVGPEQMPEVWKIYQELNARLGLDPLPELYVTNGNGVVNAYALSCNTRRKYIVLHAEVAMAVREAPQILQFVLAHEMAHHKLRHVSLWRLVIGVVPGLLKPLGVSATRAQEYSADRVAMAVCNRHHEAMGLLAAGPWMYGDVNMEAWLDQCAAQNRELYVRLVNLMSDHAVMVKRYKALRDIEKHGYGCHGDMF